MPYTAAHKQNTRTRIVQSARRLFNRSGFSDVSIGEIMASAGLTHGGFYKHFATKEDLYEVAVLQFIRAEVPEPWQRAHITPTEDGPALARMILDAYLSDQHMGDRDASCPMIALPSDISRGNTRVKAAFREVLEMMVRAFTGTLKPARVLTASGLSPLSPCSSAPWSSPAQWMTKPWPPRSAAQPAPRPSPPQGGTRYRPTNPSCRDDRLLPLREKVPEGRMRGRPQAPAPPLIPAPRVHDTLCPPPAAARSRRTVGVEGRGSWESSRGGHPAGQPAALMQSPWRHWEKP